MRPGTATRYLFTVTAGRSGQASLCDLLQTHVPGCYVAFEEPTVRPLLPGPLAAYERRFRRRFIETHELLGRGKVLTAFERSDESYLDGIVHKRLRLIEHAVKQHGASIYFDVSKYFARGLHRAFARAVPELSLIRLVRDPLLNMRSFLNRHKDFVLDNSLPDAPGNCLRLESAKMSKGELYLWAWCEMYLRFDRLVDEFRIDRAVEIRTEHLTDPGRMEAVLTDLKLPHTPIMAAAPQNTNAELGYGATRVSEDDVAVFERFLRRIPADMHRRIKYFNNYDPTAARASQAACLADATEGRR